MVFKKKLYAYRPDRPGLLIETQRTKATRRPERSDSRSLERGVRQLLADKVSGTLVGLWLLVPEHLRLGTFDLLCAWTGRPGDSVEPRLALQLVHEAALCLPGLRDARCLSQKGFELANGLPFLASDQAIHELLKTHTVAEAQQLQAALGRLRRASGHYRGRLLAIDPHRIRSYSKRQMRRHRGQAGREAIKVAQTFFCLDVETGQPVAFTTGTAARTVSQATPGLLRLAADILQPTPGQSLVLADGEHFTADVVEDTHRATPFDLLVPAPSQPALLRRLRAIPPDLFSRQWAGFATARLPYRLVHTDAGPLHLLVERCGERPEDYGFKAFLATRDGDDLDALTREFPQRWHVEEFFNAYQALGWARAGTPNLHIRYGQMTMALLAQAVLHQFRGRLGPKAAAWDAQHLAKSLLQGLDGDLRVCDDTVVVTYYNAPDVELLRRHYEYLPEKLQAEAIDPHVPWLYGLKLDFRFR